MCKKLLRVFTVAAFFLATAILWAQPTATVPDGTISTNHNVGVKFKYLDKLKSGLAVSWVVYSDTDSILEAKREERYFWVGTLDAFTFTNISIITSKEDGRVLDSPDNYTYVWGRRNGTRWQTSREIGIVDINSNPDAKIKHADDSMLYSLTNVLTMGFGLHWDVNSMRFLADGKVTGKAANFPDSLEGQLTYLPNGQIQKFFYTAPKWGQSFLLNFSYLTDQTNDDQFPSGFIQSIAAILPNGGSYAALQLEKYEILNISDITPDVAKLAGVPDRSLYKNALITNGVTKASSPYILTPKVLGVIPSGSRAQASNFEALKPIIIRIIILAVFILPLLVMAFVAFKNRRSK